MRKIKNRVVPCGNGIGFLKRVRGFFNLQVMVEGDDRNIPGLLRLAQESAHDAADIAAIGKIQRIRGVRDSLIQNAEQRQKHAFRFVGGVFFSFGHDGIRIDDAHHPLQTVAVLKDVNGVFVPHVFADGLNPVTGGFFAAPGRMSLREKVSVQRGALVIRQILSIAAGCARARDYYDFPLGCHGAAILP